MTGCLAQAAHYYHIPAVTLQSVVSAQSAWARRRVVSISPGWYRTLQIAGFNLHQVRTSPCVSLEAGSWILAYQRAATTERKVKAWATEIGHRVGVSPALLVSVAKAESDFDPLAVSSVGAMGMMQFMPDTWAQYGRGSIFDPRDALFAAARYLRALLRRYKGNVRLALAAYNAGPKQVSEHHYRLPPFAETKNYVDKVIQYWRQYRRVMS